MHIRKILGLLTILLTSLFSVQTVGAETQPITVGALRFTSHAPTFVALERGYFKDEGLDVHLKFFQAAQPMAVAIAAKDVDYGITAITGGLISLAQKGAVKVIGSALTEAPGIDGSLIIVSNKAYDAGATAPAKLQGKTWALTQSGSSFHYMGSKVAEKEHLTLKYKPLQKVGIIIGSIKSGQIDAWAIVPHIAKALDKAGAAHIIGKISDYIPDYQVTVLFTSTENADRQRQRTEAFLRAFAKGAADYNAALVDKTAGDEAAEAMVKLIHKYVYADKPYEKAARSIQNGAMRISADNALNIDSVKAQLDWFKAEKLIDDTITLDTLVDQSYLSH
ncbi:MAG: ABC transporter substrate-binding protein [Gammaproteobacteria bacterium]|nr:MAG: ABC transporter substrate-binding protein [Gammaproteobacteria bacterium]